MTASTSAVVLLSGGQDSTTCLYWARNRFDNVHTVAFDYGQRHRVELERAASIASGAEVESHVELSVEALRELGAAALTNPDITVSVDARGSGNHYAEAHGLPSTFVPGRNLLFLTLAGAHGARLGVFDLVTGVCQTDDAGYPDCRASFVTAAATAISQAFDERVSIHAPLLHRSKAQTWELADTLGVLDLVVEETMTCYHGDRTQRHEWGYGCGACGSCTERLRGWADFRRVAQLPL